MASLVVYTSFELLSVKLIIPHEEFETLKKEACQEGGGGGGGGRWGWLN